jgi:hypothetical protein
VFSTVFLIPFEPLSYALKEDINTMCSFVGECIEIGGLGC